jgi:hypothetical protein
MLQPQQCVVNILLILDGLEMLPTHIPSGWLLAMVVVVPLLVDFATSGASRKCSIGTIKTDVT